MKVNIDLIEKKLTQIIDNNLTGKIDIDTIGETYRWIPSVNMNSEEQNSFRIEEAYSKAYESYNKSDQEIKRNFEKIERSLALLEDRLRPILIRIMNLFIPRYFTNNQEMSREQYDKLLQSGLEVVMRDCAIGTKKEVFIKNHTLNKEVDNSPTIELSPQEADQLERLLAERNKLLKDGLDLIANNKLTIYAYCQTPLFKKESLNKDIEESVTISQLPDPIEIAKKFKKRDRSKNDTYSVEDIAFVMKYARDESKVNRYTDIIDSFKKYSDCPELLKDIKYKTAQRWIKYYDESAGIVRK